MNNPIMNKLTAEEKELYKDLIQDVDNNIDINSVILSDENRQKLKEFLNEYSFRDQLLSYGLNPVNRLLFYGASGTGKTYLTKALSNYMKYSMLYVDIAKSLSEDTVAMNISNIFKIANKYGKCIIFFDECDSIAWSRDSKSAEGGMVRRATNSLFQQLDQMNKTNIFVSATNMLHRLDPAFERRFDMKFEFRRPDKEIRDVVKKFLFKDFSLNIDVSGDDEQIVKRRSTLSYYELQIITERNMKKAVMRGTTSVNLSDVLNDIAIQMHMKTRFGTNKDDETVMYTSSIV